MRWLLQRGGQRGLQQRQLVFQRLLLLLRHAVVVAQLVVGRPGQVVRVDLFQLQPPGGGCRRWASIHGAASRCAARSACCWGTSWVSRRRSSASPVACQAASCSCSRARRWFRRLNSFCAFDSEAALPGTFRSAWPGGERGGGRR
ncbi:hypothetical protein [Pseudorhodoferax sp.]|uniref:hypothetical protein n=1 Tax=Pseudorhodoferax sp. TaxID=1993553 RepID=UPI0039E5B1AE